MSDGNGVKQGYLKRHLTERGVLRYNNLRASRLEWRVSYGRTV